MKPFIVDFCLSLSGVLRGKASEFRIFVRLGRAFRSQVHH